LKGKDNSVTHTGFFKKCSKCHWNWISRDIFLEDPNLKIIGYQTNFLNLELGAFLFNHSCGTTMSILAKDFVDLYHGPVYRERAVGSETCPGFCLRKEELRPCEVNCECAYLRKVATVIQSWPKRP